MNKKLEEDVMERLTKAENRIVVLESAAKVIDRLREEQDRYETENADLKAENAHYKAFLESVMKMYGAQLKSQRSHLTISEEIEIFLHGTK